MILRWIRQLINRWNYGKEQVRDLEKAIHLMRVGRGAKDKAFVQAILGKKKCQ